MKINILVIFEVDHNSNKKNFNLSNILFFLTSLEHVDKKLSLNTENLFKKYLDKLLPQPPSQFNEPYCCTFYTSYKLLDNQF